MLYRDFDHIDPRQARIILVEGGGCVLSTFAPDLRVSAERQLRKLGVEVRLNTRVTGIREGEVDLDGEPLRAGTVVWAAGVGAVPITRTLGVPVDRAGRILVGPDLSVPEHPQVFAIGDLAALTDANGQVVPGVAQGAMQGGTHVARIIAQEVETGPRAPRARPAFAYRDKGIAQIGRLHLSGFPAWLTWLAIHLIFLMGFRNRVSVFMQWVWSYFTYRRGARIIMGAKYPSSSE